MAGTMVLPAMLVMSWAMIDVVVYALVIILYIYLRQTINLSFLARMKRKAGYIVAFIARKNRVVEAYLEKPDAEGFITVKLKGAEHEKKFKVTPETVYYMPMLDAYVAFFVEDQTNAIDMFNTGQSTIDSTFHELLVLKAYELGQKAQRVDYSKLIQMIQIAIVIGIITLVVAAAAAYLAYSGMHAGAAASAAAGASHPVVQKV